MKMKTAHRIVSKLGVINVLAAIVLADRLGHGLRQLAIGAHPSLGRIEIHHQILSLDKSATGKLIEKRTVRKRQEQANAMVA